MRIWTSTPANLTIRPRELQIRMAATIYRDGIRKDSALPSALTRSV